VRELAAAERLAEFSSFCHAHLAEAETRSWFVLHAFGCKFLWNNTQRACLECGYVFIDLFFFSDAICLMNEVDVGVCLCRLLSNNNFVSQQLTLLPFQLGPLLHSLYHNLYFT